MKKLLKVYLIWLWISLIIGITLIDFWATIYFLIWVGLISTILYIKRIKIKRILENIKINRKVKFILIALIMILIEEAIVGFVRYFAGEISLSELSRTIIQLQIFNLIAIGAIVIAWTFVLWKYKFSAFEVLFISGVYGAILYEGALSFFANPIAGLISFPLLFGAHAIIYYPSYLSIKQEGTLINSKLKKWIILSIILLLQYLVTGIILGILAEFTPNLLPPD